MATLVKIRGLDRGKSVVSDGSVTGGSYRGFRIPQGMGLYYPAGVKATLTPTANTQSYTALYGGTYGNAIKVQTATGTLAVSVSYAAGTAVPTILVTAPATATLAANQAVVAAVNAHAEASQWVVAAIAGTGAAAHAVVAATNLATGTNVGTGQPIYQNVSTKVTSIVDVDDAATQKVLKRNQYRYISLGAA